MSNRRKHVKLSELKRFEGDLSADAIKTPLVHYVFNPTTNSDPYGRVEFGGVEIQFNTVQSVNGGVMLKLDGEMAASISWSEHPTVVESLYTLEEIIKDRITGYDSKSEEMVEA